jgi:hypothetical protein
MRLRFYIIVYAALLLSGCSYSYELIAKVIDGRIAFVVDPKSGHQPGCINEIEVQTDDAVHASPAPGDDRDRIGYGTFWFEVAGYECATEFPVFYGAPLKGGPPESGKEDLGMVKPKPLKVGVVYHVNTTTGATGYGGGAFRIRADGIVENVPR